MTPRPPARALVLIAAALALAGCEHVKPWERNLLAKPDMAWDVDTLAAGQANHTHFSKEAAMPGGGAGGGGCGCN